jgi:DNA-binding beta-propeller fold protein YncE
MRSRWITVVVVLIGLPWLLGAEWLITTHSGSDVLRYDDQTKSLTVLVAPGAGGLDQARGITLGPRGDLLVCSAASSNWAILRYDLTGKSQGTAAAGAGLEHPYQCLVGPQGDLFVSGQGNNAVLRYDGRTGEAKDVFVKPGAGGLDAIRGIAFHPSGDLLVAGRDNDAVLRYDGTTGQFKGEFVPKKDSKLDRPVQLHYGPDGNLYVSSSRNNSIVRFDGQTGRFIDVFVKHKAGGLDRPSGFAWGPDGDLYVASRESDQVLRYHGKSGKFKEVLLSSDQDKRIREPEFILLVNP